MQDCNFDQIETESIGIDHVVKAPVMQKGISLADKNREITIFNTGNNGVSVNQKVRPNGPMIYIEDEPNLFEDSRILKDAEILQ